MKFGEKRALALGADTTRRRNLVAAEPCAGVASGAVTCRLEDDEDGSRFVLPGVRGDDADAALEDDDPADCFRELDLALIPRPLYLSPFDLSGRGLASTTIPGEGDEKNLFLKPLRPRPGDRIGVMGVVFPLV